MEIRKNATEDALFRACTTISVHNGQRTSFWHDRWLHDQCPKEFAPNLYRLAYQKRITVAQGCMNSSWMRGLQAITSTDEINQFVQLWNMLRQV
jgi:hypothetical protein